MRHNVLGAGGVSELLWLERTEGYAEKFLDHQPLNEGDSTNIFGHSGCNASGIDTALYARKRGMNVIAITAKSNLDKPASHSSGKRLADAADIVTDTCSPIEDAIVPVENWSRPVAGSSTVLAMMMMHELVARTATRFHSAASNFLLSPPRPSHAARPIIRTFISNIWSKRALGDLSHPLHRPLLRSTIHRCSWKMRQL